MTLFKFDFDFIRNRYDYELHRREQLTAALTLPVGVLGGLGSLLAVMARTFSYERGILTVSFLCALFLAVVAFLGCLIYLARGYHRQTYEFLPTLSRIDESRREFVMFAEAMAFEEAEVIEEFDMRMRRRMIEAADRNTATNDDRNELLQRAPREWLFALLFLTAVTGVPYLLDHVRILVVSKSTTTQPAPEGPTPASSKPQWPEVPPNRVIRDGQLPVRPLFHGEVVDRWRRPFRRVLDWLK